jgi:hypothetical protein
MPWPWARGRGGAPARSGGLMRLSPQLGGGLARDGLLFRHGKRTHISASGPAGYPSRLIESRIYSHRRAALVVAITTCARGRE